MMNNTPAAIAQFLYEFIPSSSSPEAAAHCHGRMDLRLVGSQSFLEKGWEAFIVFAARVR
jgi:hypothetical protein